MLTVFFVAGILVLRWIATDHIDVVLLSRGLRAPCKKNLEKDIVGGVVMAEETSRHPAPWKDESFHLPTARC